MISRRGPVYKTSDGKFEKNMNSCLFSFLSPFITSEIEDSSASIYFTFTWNKNLCRSTRNVITWEAIIEQKIDYGDLFSYLFTKSCTSIWHFPRTGTGTGTGTRITLFPLRSFSLWNSQINRKRVKHTLLTRRASDYSGKWICKSLNIGSGKLLQDEHVLPSVSLSSVGFQLYWIL